MKTKTLFFILLLGATLFLVSLNVFQNGLGPHGGHTREAGKYVIEMRNAEGQFCTFLLDAQSKAMSNKSMTCEVLFLYPDSTSLHQSLLPYETEGFTASAGSAGFSSCRITFTLSGHTVSAWFEKESTMARSTK